MGKADCLFLAVTGGGTGCRARLCNASETLFSEAEGGPANIRYGLREAFASVLDATLKCLEHARPKPCEAVTNQ